MKTAVISGATSGIGRAIARRLAADGYFLAVISRSEEAVSRLAGELQLESDRWRGFLADFASADSAENVASELAATFAELDLLVHCAGWLESGTVEKDDGRLLDLHYRINARAPYLLCQRLLPALRRRQGQIVFINSSASQQSGKPELSAYVGSKLMLKGIADCLRQEVNADGIRVTSFYPGQTATPMQAQIQAAAGNDYRPERLMQPEDIAEMVMSTLALPRTAEVTDVAIRPARKP